MELSARSEVGNADTDGSGIDGSGIDGSRTDSDGDRSGAIAPHWFELITLACIVTLATVGSAGLLLAIVGRYTTVAALAIGVPLAAFGVFALHRGLPRGGTSRAAQVGAGIAVAIAVGYAVFAGLAPSQNVVLDRDPGSYLATAVQLSREGALQVDARGDAFKGIRGLKFSGAAVYNIGSAFPGNDVPTQPGEVRDNGNIQPQFNHLASVALAVALDVGGNRLMFRLPALMAALGLLMLYAVTVRTSGRPLISLFAPALLAVSMPLLHVARDTYSETFTMALLWGAVLVLVGVHGKPRVQMAAIGGLLLGALVCTRVDALMYVGLLPPLAAVSIATAATPTVRNARIRAWLIAAAVTAVVGAIGWWDLSERTGQYVAALAPQLRLLRAALVASVVLSAVGLALWLFVAPVRTISRRASRPVALVASATVGGMLLLGWLVRPYVQTAVTGQKLPVVQSIQAAEGLPLEPFRSYAEDSLQWMSWYLGAPTLLVAIAALTWGTWTVLRGRGHAPMVTLLVLCLAAGALYWYDPQITPDQVWATRRFIPAVLPALTLWASVGVALCASVPFVRRCAPALRCAAVGVTGIALLAPPVLVTAPVMWQRVQAGYLKPVLDTCSAVGPDSAVIVVGGYASATLPQSLRGWCDVPVAAEGSALKGGKLGQVAAQVRANGYQLYLVSADVADLDPFLVPGGPAVRSSVGVVNPWTVEQTLDRPPSSYLNPDDVVPVPTPFTLYSVQVAQP